MRVLVVNAGSSSLKLSALEGDDTLAASANLSAWGGRPDEGELAQFTHEHGPFDAVGHRVVHGGTTFTQPVVVDDDVTGQLQALTSLAPLHQPGSLAGLAMVSKLLPKVPAVACFDTAFHSTLPPEAHTYAVPQEWRQRWGVRRYGFHGLSHAYASRRVAELVPVPASGRPLRLVNCHLGAGASLCAVVDGRSVATTMGFTPLEGLVMATRSGTVDPGLVLWLTQQAGLCADEISDALEHRSGLAALAGTADMRQVQARAGSGDEGAVLALAVYVHQLVALVASMAAALGGLDALCFTGGVGEHAPEVRVRAAQGLAFLGVGVDEDANQAAEPDCDVSLPGAAVRALVVTAREDLEIARGVRSLLG